MKRHLKVRLIYIVMVILFSITFLIGIFQNPNFNIHDFCMNLASEILGLVLALTIVEIYIRERKK